MQMSLIGDARALAVRTASTALARFAPSGIALRRPVREQRQPDVGDFTNQVKIGYRDYVEEFINPQWHQSLQRDADIGIVSMWMQWLDHVATEPRVASVLRTRKLAVAGSPWVMRPASESAADEAIALEAEAFVKAIPHTKQFFMDLLDAVYRAIAVVQPEWAVLDSIGPNGRRLVDRIVSYKAIESRYFRFDMSDLNTPLICTDDAPNGKPFPVAGADSDGLLMHVVRDKAGPVVRGGIGRSISKYCLYKQFNLMDCTAYLERFGHPHVQIEYPPHIRENSPEMQRIKDAVRSIMVDHASLVPVGVKLTFLEAVNKSADINGVYLAFMRYCDSTIAAAVLGGTLTVEAGPGGLGHGREAAEHGEVRQDIKELDADQLEDTLNTQLLAQWCRRNYPGAAPPRIEFIVEAPQDAVQTATAQKLRAEALCLLRSAGMVLSKVQIRDDFQLEEPVNAEDALEPAPLPAPLGSVENASPVQGAA